MLLITQGAASIKRSGYPIIPLKPLSNETPWPHGNQSASELVGFDYDGLKPLADNHFIEQGEYQIKASSLAVVYNGQLIYEKYAEGTSSNIPIYGFSLGKTIAALFSGILVKEKSLDIYAPTQLPEWKGDERALITPHQLLTMTSCLQWNEIFDDPSTDLGAVFSEEDLGSFAADKPLVAIPGSKFNYSSGSTMILSKVIKNLLGGEFAGAYQGLHESLFRKQGSPL